MRRKERLMGVAVMGVGFCGSFPTSTGLSYRELIARAAEMAYADAGIEPEDLDGGVSVEEDFVSGYSIADEYVPDQLGLVRKPIYTICGDFLHGIGSAVMQIETGVFDTVVVEAYCKASNILNKDELLHFAFDPVLNRLGVSPHYLAGLEMQRFLDASFSSLQDVAQIRHPQPRRRGRQPPRALWRPHRPRGRDQRSPRRHPADGADDRPARRRGGLHRARQRRDGPRALPHHPVFIAGTGWASGNSVIERRELELSEATAMAAEMACAEAGVESISDELDLFYVSDLYAYRQAMHMEALGLGEEHLPFINPDGGSLGGGDLLEVNGGARMVDAVMQLRGEAGAHQVGDVESALVHGWRGLPTDSCAVVILDAERG